MLLEGALGKQSNGVSSKEGAGQNKEKCRKLEQNFLVLKCKEFEKFEEFEKDGNLIENRKNTRAR